MCFLGVGKDLVTYPKPPAAIVGLAVWYVRWESDVRVSFGFPACSASQLLFSRLSNRLFHMRLINSCPK